MYDRKKLSLGIFDTKQQAALAYDREARQCGKDKTLNYESIAAAEEAAVQAQAVIKPGLQRCKPKPKPNQAGLPPPGRPPSGFYGVTAARKRWLAQIYYDNKRHRLGSFGTKQEAALAYDREARQCGKGKALNYESIAAAEAAAATAAQVLQEAAAVG
jgi:hypothetical protein